MYSVLSPSSKKSSIFDPLGSSLIACPTPPHLQIETKLQPVSPWGRHALKQSSFDALVLVWAGRYFLALYLGNPLDSSGEQGLYWLLPNSIIHGAESYLHSFIHSFHTELSVSPVTVGPGHINQQQAVLPFLKSEGKNEKKKRNLDTPGNWT